MGGHRGRTGRAIRVIGVEHVLSRDLMEQLRHRAGPTVADHEREEELRLGFVRLAEGVGQRLLAEIQEVRRTGIGYDRDEHTVGISAAGVAERLTTGHIVAVSVPAPTERFRANEAVIVDARRAAAAGLRDAI